MKIKLLLSVNLVLFFFLVGIPNSIAQRTSTMSDSIAQRLTAREFDDFILPIIDTMSLLEEPGYLKTALEIRLNKNLYTSDDAILAILNLYEKYETELSSNKSSQLTSDYFIEKSKPLGKNKNFKHKSTYDITEFVLSKIYKQDLLKAKLLELKARILFLNGHERLNEQTQVHQIYDNLHWQIDAKKIEYSIIVGYALFSKKRFEEASKYFQVGSQYPWYGQILFTEDSATMQQRIKNSCLTASKGWIQANRHDKELIKRFYIQPAFKSELEPLIESILSKEQKN